MLGSLAISRFLFDLYVCMYCKVLYGYTLTTCKYLLYICMYLCMYACKLENDLGLILCMYICMHACIYFLPLPRISSVYMYVLCMHVMYCIYFLFVCTFVCVIRFTFTYLKLSGRWEIAN